MDRSPAVNLAPRCVTAAVQGTAKRLFGRQFFGIALCHLDIILNTRKIKRFK